MIRLHVFFYNPIKKKRELLDWPIVMRSVLVFFFFLSSVLYAQEGHFFSAGAELSHIKRMRDGGTQQEGYLNGMRFSYDRIQRSSWYGGVDYFLGTASLLGHTGAGRTLASNLSDQIGECRIGWTLGRDQRNAFFSFFAGYGKFKETHDFSKQVHLPILFQEKISYVPIGFLSGTYLTPLFGVGFNFKIMAMLRGESTIQNDPYRPESTLQMTNESQLRWEVPCWYRVQRAHFYLSAGMTPFLEYRHFGGREGFPYNFLDTKFILLGGRISLLSRF